MKFLDFLLGRFKAGNVIATTGDAAYVLACGNLINAALNKQVKSYEGSQKLTKEVYSFKFVVGRAIEDIITIRPPDVSVYIEGKGLVYVNVLGIQFSFHALPRTPMLVGYQRSELNKPQEWSGLRLQPIAPLILRWAETVLLEEK